MIEVLQPSTTEIYEAVVALSRSIAGRSDLESWLSGVGESVRRIVGFDYVGLTLHDEEERRDAGSFPEQAGEAMPPALLLLIRIRQGPGMPRSAAARDRFSRC